MRPLFTGYSEFIIASDALLSKWQACHRYLSNVPLDHEIALTKFDVDRFNTDINRMIKYVAEPVGADEWQTPAITLAKLDGDCEDIAILKYALLMKSGVSEDDMRISLGRIRSLNIDHAWLALWLDGGWRVLDNKFDHLITPDDYVTNGNWLPLAAVWDDQCVRFGRRFVLAER